MLNELLKEIEELKKYKEKYEYAVKDKEIMSELLYEYMTKEYESMTKEERVKIFEKEFCECCRFAHYCRDHFEEAYPEDILKPFPSERAWIPPRKGCAEFEWS